jgi:hypothetical protein
MPKILFTESCEVARQDGRGRVFEAGEVHDLPHASVRHWTERGKGTTDRNAIIAAEAMAVVKSGAVAEGSGGFLVPEGLVPAIKKKLADSGVVTGEPVRIDPTQPVPPAVDIPVDWRTLPWPTLKSLASKVAPETAIKTKADAEAAVEAELARRAGA